MIRLFAGIAIPQPIKQSLTLLRGPIDGAHWVADENLHITLRFIGTLDPPLAEDVAISLGTVRFESFSLTPCGVGLFGTPEKPRLLYVGIEKDEALQKLHQTIDRRLVDLGLSPENRTYTPHITLARMKGRSRRVANYLNDHSLFKAPAFAVSRITLFQSHPGPHYQPVADFPAIDATPDPGSG
ncbi:RNA 2',3'-cyclic phosphodiesterase [Iodidimonas nitroreducens]|uniref:RNA 2',3'-cyclic phosphodiesterase n=1 Tax=Iodidimonas nitroreducens TaxID=1236968 RepID=A0A5A7NAE2_9PROT|nr:RNA 2',3'-cyclic phosphodiesterase [Iodidimonas nitroreducens]GER04430.1 RNA 2',3'-cyclic phosphodiesterase [Iodidimonas nitroreducens]